MNRYSIFSFALNYLPNTRKAGKQKPEKESNLTGLSQSEQDAMDVLFRLPSYPDVSKAALAAIHNALSEDGSSSIVKNFLYFARS